MRNPLGLIAVVAIGGLLAACSNNTAQISKMKVKGGAYEKGLHKGYVNLARAEHKEDDWSDAGKFEERAKMAATGKPTAPEMLSARALPKKYVKELDTAYGRLTSALDKDGAKKNGKFAALAQTNFDCWMQEAEEDTQPKHISACRSMFYGALAILEESVNEPKMMKTAAKPKKKKARKPQTVKYVVYFDFNSAELNRAGMNAIDFMKSNVKKNAKVSLSAYTDRSGSTEYNNILASKRAKAVYAALEKAGIKSEIGVSVFGEEQNTVKTNDGVKERLNRRVEVSVTQ